MKFTLETAEVFIPNGAPVEEALASTTHLALAAHQDDIEIMAIDGILKCYHNAGQRFSGIVTTNGSGSPRDDLYASYSDAEMQVVRRHEQRAAAVVGDYAAQILLDHPSASVKDPRNAAVVADLKQILLATRPQVVYTHNLADKHDTHVAVALKALSALRSLPAELRPAAVYGCEVWRGLDWMLDAEKVAFDCSARESLQAALLGVFDSQICGGKRYDLATMGRRRANATYYASHATDTTTGMVFAMDLTPLVTDPALDIAAYVQGAIHAFAEDVRQRLGRYLP
ncbi:MAG: PIG-L family deacetylase [Anaerolineae bacterium]|nr:PIG-L family deacetylase [Anaerolineae bacterium]